MWSANPAVVAGSAMANMDGLWKDGFKCAEELRWDMRWYLIP
jgi:hypothetical protein